MFEKLGNFVSSHPWWFLTFWPIFGLLVIWLCPTLTEVTVEGGSVALPSTYESRKVDEKLASSFKGYGTDSSDLIVILHRQGGLIEDDFSVAIPAIVDKLGQYHFQTVVNGKHIDTKAIDADILTAQKDPALADRLNNKDRSATIIAARVATVFISSDTRHIVKSVIRFLDGMITNKPRTEHHAYGMEQLLPYEPELSSMCVAGQEHGICIARPPLEYHVTGSAVIGHDYGEAVDQSMKRTEVVTYLMVVLILILIYRSPLAAIVPLLTILLSLRIAMSVVAIFAKYVTQIPTMVPVFMTVVMFGAGTNYCLFLVGRYKEELGRGLGYKDAARTAIAQVGRALGTSAGAEILGLCVLVFAQFEIFSRTGVAVGLSLIAALLAAMTLAPAMFLVLRQKAFWPQRAEAAMAGTLTTRLWRWVAAGVCRHPGRILIVAFILMAPFVYFGITMVPSYDLFSELPKDMHSVAGHDFLLKEYGNQALSEQLCVMVSSDVDVTSAEGLAALTRIVTALQADNRVVEVRSLVTPLGKPIAGLNSTLWWKGSLLLSKGNRMRQYADEMLSRYASKDRRSTVIDIVIKEGDFTRRAMDSVPDFRAKVRELVAQSGLPGGSAMVGGLTAYMNDLRDVTNRDMQRVIVLVLIMVYLILVWLMRDWFSPLYMLATMVLSYLVTMGMADVVFHHIFRAAGLDWKVRFFLFVLLIAIGEDYNIYLMSRVREEAFKHGMREGIRRAIVYTGSIISACGLIMAGTFGAMLAGRIALMVHIGFAMVFGILMDTFIIRPVIVPSIALIFRKYHYWYKDIPTGGGDEPS